MAEIQMMETKKFTITPMSDERALFNAIGHLELYDEMDKVYKLLVKEIDPKKKGYLHRRLGKLRQKCNTALSLNGIKYDAVPHAFSKDQEFDKSHYSEETLELSKSLEAMTIAFALEKDADQKELLRIGLEETRGQLHKSIGIDIAAREEKQLEEEFQRQALSQSVIE